MEQQSKKNKRNILIYLGIAAGILTAVFIAYHLAWASSSDKKEDEHSKTAIQKNDETSIKDEKKVAARHDLKQKEGKRNKESSNNKTAQQKSRTTSTKSTAKATSYQTALKYEQSKIKKALCSMVDYEAPISDSLVNNVWAKVSLVLIIHMVIIYRLNNRIDDKNLAKANWFKKYFLFLYQCGDSTSIGVVQNFFLATLWLGFYVVVSILADFLGWVDLISIEQLKTKASALPAEVNLRNSAKGEQSKTFLKECQEAKKTFETTHKAREASFKKEEVALNKKLDAIPSVEELEKAISAAQQARDKAKNEEDANEEEKQKAMLAALEHELAYANAVAANNKVKKGKQATEQQKKTADRNVAKARNRLKTPEYKAAKAAFEAHKAHADFLQDAIDIMDTLIKRT